MRFFGRKPSQEIITAGPSKEIAPLEGLERDIEAINIEDEVNDLHELIKSALEGLYKERSIFHSKYKNELNVRQAASALMFGDDPMAIEARIHIWRVLASEFAVIEKQAEDVLAEAPLLAQQMAKLESRLNELEKEITQTSNNLRQDELKIAEEELGLREPDPLYGKTTEQNGYLERRQHRHLLITTSYEKRAGLQVQINSKQGEIDRNYNQQYLVKCKISNFKRLRLGPEIDRCNILRREAVASTEQLLEAFRTDWTTVREIPRDFIVESTGSHNRTTQTSPERELGTKALSPGAHVMDSPMTSKDIIDELLGQSSSNQVLTGSVVRQNPEERS